MKPTVVAVIVTFNRLDALKLTVEKSLLEPFTHIIVVDNASTDGTSEWLGALFDERLVVLTNTVNTGGAGGFNRGFDYAANQTKADWLVCFDDDAWPQEGAINIFQSAQLDDSVGGAAAAVYLPDNTICEMNRPSLNPFWHASELIKTALKGRSGFHISDADYLEEGREIDASSFVGCFIRLELIRSQAIGLPRTELFIYADDIIYTLELRKSGFKHVFLPEVKFTHDCETLVEQKPIYSPLWKAYFVYRNRLEMYRVAAGVFFPFVSLLKICQGFFDARFYQGKEKVMFKQLTRAAVKDGMKQRYNKSLEDVKRIIGS